ncbi:MAG: hypothetical protein ACI4QJ_05090 [Candidatus Spyradenecus sp.]
MKLKSSNHSPSVAARASFVLFVFFVVAICWIVDGTDAALALECDLAERMACALRALLRGLCLSDALHCSVAPACSGLRTAVAAALFALALPTAQRPGGASRSCGWSPPGSLRAPRGTRRQALFVGPVARHTCRAALGALAGLWLNLARLLAIELAMRLSPALGQTLHAFALPLIIAPLAAALLALITHLCPLGKLLLSLAAALLLALLLNAPAFYLDWEVLQ